MNMKVTMKRSAVLALALAAASTMGALAQGPVGPGAGPGAGPRFDPMDKKSMGGPNRLLPPGTWWRDQQVATAIGLTPDQQKKIDGIFLDARVQLIHMHASLEESQLRLDDTLSAPTLDAVKAQKEIDESADTRASLEKAEAHMLLTIRGVLTADQWIKLQSVHPRHGEMVPDRGRGKGLRRDGPRDNGMPQPPAPGQRPDGPPSPQDDQQ